jgi:hypothetical protein
VLAGGQALVFLVGVKMLMGGLMLAAAVAAGQETAAKDTSDISLDDLLDTPLSVATKGARKSRETPGVVTALNREEILASGARDLLSFCSWCRAFRFTATSTTPSARAFAACGATRARCCC